MLKIINLYETICTSRCMEITNTLDRLFIAFN
uniref:Uncharacterized protein n=1 Tax=Arundo donax TaxID=35708 RepID=A0A0A9FF89_ARUDO